MADLRRLFPQSHRVAVAYAENESAKAVASKLSIGHDTVTIRLHVALSYLGARLDQVPPQGVQRFSENPKSD